MPTLTKDGASAVSYVPSIFTIPLEYHLLRTLSVIDISGLTHENDIRIEAGILIGNAQQNTKIAILLGGYIGAVPGLGWSGSIPCEPGMQLYCEVTTLALTTVRLSAILWKIIMKEGGQFVLDP